MIPEHPEFYKELLDRMYDGVYFVDRDRRIVYWNQGAYRLTGYTAEEVVGHFCQDDILNHMDYEGNLLCHMCCPLQWTIENAQEREARVFLRHKEGRRVPVRVRAQPMFDSDGQIIGGIEIFSDDTCQAEVQRKMEDLKRLAFLDHLTGLPNRRFMEMALQTALNEFRLHKDPFAVASMDLDLLKDINDSCGHESGDLVLKETACTLLSSFRSSDVVGRWGGDEFIAIIHNASEPMLTALVSRCVALVGQTSIPLPEGRKLRPSISVGASLATLDDSVADILRRADQRMYESKSAGRGRQAGG